MNSSSHKIDCTHLSFDQAMAFSGLDQGDTGQERVWPDINEIELSQSRANELLDRPVLYLHESMALTTGLDIDPMGGKSFLCPDGQGLLAAERLLADKHNGRLVFPLMREEFVSWADDWLEYLPDATLAALRNFEGGLNPVLVESARVRSNSREVTLRQAANRVEQACRVLESQGVVVDRQSLPGTKAPFIAYLMTFPEFVDHATDTVRDYLEDIPGFRWAGGRPNKGATAHIFACLSLRRSDIPR